MSDYQQNTFPDNRKKPISLLVSGISLSPDDSADRAIEEAKDRLRRVGLPIKNATAVIFKKSVDARVRGGVRTVKLVYSVLVTLPDVISLKERQRVQLEQASVRVSENIGEPAVEYGTEEMNGRPLVVGMGPAGLFCALLLAEHGYRPIIIDRGDDVRRRVAVNECFMQTGKLDTESNVQFGAGGAGTFSDGKLITRINDPHCQYVLRRFADCGAPSEIMTDARPHIGTDLLVGVVEQLLSRISALGGEVHYRTRLDGISSAGSERELIAKTTSGDIPCGALVLALGHSARDTNRMLISMGLPVTPKPFSVGVRVEHLQKDIDRALYGDYAGHPAIGCGEYNLSDTKGDRGVYTFCMCPGGSVIAAASEEGGVVVNGMSHHARDGANAVAAVAVSVFAEDYGNTPEGGMAFQRALEEKAFVMGGGDYAAPMQMLGDFMEGTLDREPGKIQPTYTRGKVTSARLDLLFPEPITSALKRGFSSFGRKLPGYDDPSAVLTGVESRTSSPVRILRSQENLTAMGFPLIYPIGEGAGYAGGITSAAVDGIRAALAMMKKFRPTGE